MSGRGPESACPPNPLAIWAIPGSREGAHAGAVEGRPGPAKVPAAAPRTGEGPNGRPCSRSRTTWPGRWNAPAARWWPCTPARALRPRACTGVPASSSPPTTPCAHRRSSRDVARWAHGPGRARRSRSGHGSRRAPHWRDGEAGRRARRCGRPQGWPRRARGRARAPRELGAGQRARRGLADVAGGEVDRFVRLDLVLYPGFSGGPLVDATGAVTGIVTSGLSRQLELAVPVSTVSRVVDELARDRADQPRLSRARIPAGDPARGDAAARARLARAWAHRGQRGARRPRRPRRGDAG